MCNIQKKSRGIQIKTLEKMIIEELEDDSKLSDKTHEAFGIMFDHYADEEYLHGVPHPIIIEKIYISHIYEHKTAKAFAAELHLDAKTLLVVRKCYMRLFIKYYFGLREPPENEYDLIYKELKKIKKLRKRMATEASK